MVGMLWSGIMTFLILLCMEAVIIGYRKIFRIQEPEFALILDEDIILDHEIADEYLSAVPNEAPKESRELQLMAPSRGSSNEPVGPREMPVDEAALSGPDRKRPT
jgi:hypothetical protein